MTEEYCTMSIASLGPATLEKPKPRFPSGIRRDDIIEPETNFTRTFTQFRSTFNSTADIAGATSHGNYMHQRNCFHTLLEIDDIEGTRARVTEKMHLTNRRVNPLEPHYTLPSAIAEPEPLPKFLRDSMSVQDIDGAQIKNRTLSTIRDTMNTLDIDGAQASWRPIHRRIRNESPAHDIMSVGIDVKKKVRLSNRGTDPVAPSYFIHGQPIEDDPRYTKPAPLKRFIEGNHLLLTSDILGASAKKIEDVYESRRDFRNTNFLGDIIGAQADSIKHSIVTNRTTNPLNPLYPSLDDGIPLRGPVDSLIPPSVINTPTVFVKKVTAGGHLRTTDGDRRESTSQAPQTIEISSYLDKTMDSKDRIGHVAGAKPPPIPIEKLSRVAQNELKGFTENSGRGSAEPNLGTSARGSGRNALAKSSSEPSLSSRTPTSMSARRAMEERRMEVESVRGLS